MDGTLAQVIMFAGNFAPRNWAYCQGQLLSIAQNQALFSLLGTTFGGDGRTSFGLPDLRGRTPVGTGNGPGLTPRSLGQKSGAEYNYLTVANLPSHTHTASGKLATGGDNALSDISANNLLASEARGGGDALNIYNSGAGTGYMADGSVQVTVGNTGANQAVNNMQPYLAMNFIICTSGIFPSRS